ncbi:MAG: hypothetical protein R3D03_04565 [Geminicoccaceae bacterium]
MSDPSSHPGFMINGNCTQGIDDVALDDDHLIAPGFLAPWSILPDLEPPQPYW